MNVRLNGFNRIAPYYDRLKRFVFGKSIYNSQVHFLESIPLACDVLILGGGSGEILTALLARDPAVRIWYVEASAEMLALASKRLVPQFRGNVTFIHGNEESLPEGIVFGSVITHFFLDLFPDKEARRICEKIYLRMADGAVWLVSDFVNSGTWWQKLLLSAMYRFFILTCGIQATRLPHWQEQLRRCGLREINSAHFFGGFIKTAVYARSGD